MLSLFSSLLPKVKGGRLERPQRGAKGPPGFTEEQSRRESGGHLFPRPQACRTRMGCGRDFIAPACRPPGVDSRGSWWGAWWVEEEIGSKTPA